ncbi:MAG: FtsX-like permease family protein, partial [Acidiferrobacterales bacterium]|nr:FtsX-like permease family protein [Acidiferrobacterales bacterium]
MILLLVLACGAMVLFASIGVSFDERLRENAILRTLGSSKKVILGALTVEYMALGLVSGLIASVGAEIVLYFVQTQVFELTAVLHPSLWALGIISGMVLITVLGLIRSREIITVPPLESLRRLA